MKHRVLLPALLSLLVSGSIGSAGTTVFHFRVNEDDAGALPAVPSVGGSPGIAQGVFTGLLSPDVPTVGVPSGAGNRSLVGAGAADSDGVNSSATLELSNAAIITEGGFTMETWFKWNGAGTVNSIIDYAGTEKFRITSAGGYNLDMNFDAASGPLILATAPTAGEWHYVAMVFTHDGNPEVAGRINGTMTWYYDGDVAVGSVPAMKGNFGDSLNRPIGVGRHPIGFAGDDFDGLVYEPRVTLGALAATELLYNPPSTHDPQIGAIADVTAMSNGSPLPLTLAVRNLSGTTQELVLGPPVFSGMDADAFEVVTYDTPIAPDGGTGEIAVLFTPVRGDGRYEAILTIPSNDAEAMSMEVMFTVDVRDPVIEIDSLLNFGALPEEPGPQTGTVTVRNLGGTTALTLANPTLTGPAASHFAVTSLPASVEAGLDDSIEITFTPDAGGLFIAQLALETNDASFPVVTVGLAAFVGGAIDLEGPSKLSHWTFDDPNDLGDDSGGLNYDGTVIGDVATSNLAAVGSGAVMLGGDLDYIEIPQGDFAYDQLAADGEGFSVATWVCSSSQATAFTRQRYFSKFFDTGGGAFGIGQDGDTAFIATTYGIFDFVGGTRPAADEWHHVAYVFRNSPPSVVDVYVDGVLGVSLPGTGGFVAGAGSFAIGGLGGLAGEWFNGLLDDLRVYAVELNATQIATLASMGTPGGKIPAGPPLRITSVSRVGDILTITWNSREGEVYAANYSFDLSDWGADFNDSIPADAGNETTQSFDLGALNLADQPQLYVRVTRL